MHTSQSHRTKPAQDHRAVRGHGPLRRIRVNTKTMEVEVTPIEETTFLVEATTIAVETFRVRATSQHDAALLVEHKAQENVFAHDFPVTISRTTKVIATVNAIPEEGNPE